MEEELKLYKVISKFPTTNSIGRISGTRIGYEGTYIAFNKDDAKSQHRGLNYLREFWKEDGLEAIELDFPGFEVTICNSEKISS